MSTTSVTTEPAVTTAEVNTCLLLARAFALPREFSDEDPELLRQAVSGLPAQLADSGRRLADAWEAARRDGQALDLAHARLFLGPFEILASPYASTYLEPEGRLMGEVSNRVAACYAEAGLEPGRQPVEVPDHIALEWEFLYYLGYRALETGEAAWTDRFTRFVREHLGLWTLQLAEQMRRADQHPFYNTLADFCREFTQYLLSEAGGVSH